MYRQDTDGIIVTVKPVFLDDQSAPDKGRYVWAYHVRIQNSSPRTVQLINRHWRITDANGTCQNVDGPGVVGEQPVLKPGEQYDYSSGCPLPTPSGFMVGTYDMVTTDDGQPLVVAIPAFSLDSPFEKQAVH